MLVIRARGKRAQKLAELYAYESISMTSRMTKFLITLAAFSASLLNSSPAAAASITTPPARNISAQRIPLTVLQAKIEATHAGWTAGESTVSRMSESEWAALLGLKVEDAPDVLFDNHRGEAATIERGSQSNFVARTSGAGTLDWRNHNGANWVSPILDQGKCGSCVAFSSIGTMETQLRIESGYSGFNAKLSPQYLFSCGGAYCAFGWEPSSAAKFLQTYGATDESCMPYTSESGSTASCRSACGDAASRRVRISSYSQPTSSDHNLAAIKAALRNGPLETTMNVYQDFMYYLSGVYKHVSGKRAGSHAISIVGYDDNLRALIIRNSWGPDWGEMGFARVSYDDVSGIGDSTWSYQISPFNGISLNAPVDGSYATGSVTVQTHSTIGNVERVRANIFDAKNQMVLSQPVTRNVINTASLSDGRFEIEVQALGRNGMVLATSQRHYFFKSAPFPVTQNRAAGAKNDQAASLSKVFSIQNPILQISLNDAQSTTPTLLTPDQTLQARIQNFRVHANVGDKELTRVAFHYRKNSGGGVTGLTTRNEVVRSAEHLVDGASLSWKTDGLSAGTYEYWITGEIDGEDLKAQAESPHQMLTISSN